MDMVRIVSLANTEEDPIVTTRPGWEGMHIWWLVGRGSSETQNLLVNIAEWPPGKAHEVHRHHGAPEAMYVLSGSGLWTSDGEPVRLSAGEIGIAEPGEWHGFVNDTDEPVRVLAVWGNGVDHYEDLGYEVLPDWQSRLPEHLRHLG
jgi:quercetin dioxygenase-like cupin family protein